MIIERSLHPDWLSNTYLVGDKPGGKAVAIDAGGPSTLDKTVRTTTEYQPKPVVKRASSREVGSKTMKVSVTVNVPRGYFVSLAMQGKPADEKEPDEAALKPIIDKQLSQLLATAKPESLAAEKFAQTSVAVQGLPALERLLYGDTARQVLSAGPEQKARIAVIQAIALRPAFGAYAVNALPDLPPRSVAVSGASPLQPGRLAATATARVVLQNVRLCMAVLPIFRADGLVK